MRTMIPGPSKLPLRIALTVLVVALPFIDHFSEPFIPRYQLLPRALIEDGSVAITRYVGNPSTTPDIAVKDGQVLAGTYPGVAIAILPATALGLGLGRAGEAGITPWFGPDFNAFLVLLSVLLVVIPVLAAAAWNISRALEHLGLSPREVTLWSLTLVLGTPIIFYGVRLHEAAFVFFLESVIIALLARDLELVEPRSWLVLGLCLGGLDLFNPVAMMVSLGAIVALRGPRLSARHLAYLGAGFIPAELLLRGYLFSAFGSPLASPYKFLPGPSVMAVWQSRGIEGSVREIVRCIPEIAWGTTFGITGLFTFAPVMLLVVVLLARSPLRPWSRAGWVAYLANQAVVMTFIHGLWSGGKSWGPRYLLAAIPWMVVGAAASRRTRGLAALGALSIAITWLGLQFGTVTTPLAHALYFFLAGPTTPYTRLASHLAETEWVPSRIAAGMHPSASGQYYALTHISSATPYLFIACALYWIWRDRGMR